MTKDTLAGYLIDLLEKIPEDFYTLSNRIDFLAEELSGDDAEIDEKTIKSILSLVKIATNK